MGSGLPAPRSKKRAGWKPAPPIHSIRFAFISLPPWNSVTAFAFIPSISKTTRAGTPTTANSVAESARRSSFGCPVAWVLSFPSSMKNERMNVGASS